MRLFKKELYLDQCPILYTCQFTPEVLERDFEIRGGKWYVENNWLIGENSENLAAMVITKASYCENVMLDFLAATVPPCTHDINVMWNGSWNEEKNERDVAYVAGLQGWWDGKVGFEKSPDYKLNAATKGFNFVPGQEYHVQVGSIDGQVFIVVDGNLILEVTDPDPIDFTKHGRVGMEAYCTKVRFANFSVKRVVYEEIEEMYTPEF